MRGSCCATTFRRGCPARKRRPSSRRCRRIGLAHGRGLLHRDVKPANILLTDPATGPRRILLADFGIARRLDDTTGLTVTNMTLGTLSYAAPEQLTGGSIDGRADQFALAATAFHLLTGAAPDAHSSPAVVINRRLSATPPRLVLMGRSEPQPTSAPSLVPAKSSTQTAVGPPSTVTVTPPTITAQPQAQVVLPDADTHGFVAYSGGARCSGSDRAELIVRTAESALVVCESDSGGAYYRGYRLSDGATLELGNVVTEGTGLVAVNPADGTRYEVSTAELQIVQNGKVVSNEPALESAS
jgi:serine/threonine protein kinase